MENEEVILKFDLNFSKDYGGNDKLQELCTVFMEELSQILKGKTSLSEDDAVDIITTFILDYEERTGLEREVMAQVIEQLSGQ